MGQSTVNQRGQGMTRRVFLKQALGLTSASAGAALLTACGSSSATATAVPPAAQQPTALPSNVSAPTIAAAAGAVSTPATGAAPTGEATTGATTPSATAATEGVPTTSSTLQDATSKIVAAANAFLTTLSDTEKDTVLFDWTDTAQKQRWSNFPPAGFTRAGLIWGNLSEPQQNAWLAVMQATLSTEGYNRVMAEWNADDALLAQEGTGGGFGKKNYYIALIGTPSETDPWQWQWGGHHVTVNATIVGSNISLTPSFIGVQPGQYTDANGNTVRPLGDIDDEAFALVSSLDATQQKAAVLGSSPIDLVLGPGQDGKTIQAEGLPAAQMNADQQAAFLKLIGHYTGLVNDAAAAARMAEIQSTLDQTYLAWYGPTTQGSAAYFRVTGPTIVIEFSPQGGGGPGSNAAATDLHIHGIYRDPTNDYGAKYAQ
jgi:Protein of unknown function (DUF3500)